MEYRLGSTTWPQRACSMRDNAGMRDFERHAADIPIPNGKWTCPMHPEVREDAPGTCPQCGMPLVPATEIGIPDR